MEVTSPGTKYSALDQINQTNVRQLKPAWIYRCDDMRSNPASTIECNPIIVDGVMFMTTSGLKVVALDAATGTQRWIFDPWNGKGGGGVNRGVTYWSSGNDKRIFYVAEILFTRSTPRMAARFCPSALKVKWTCAMAWIGMCFSSLLARPRPGSCIRIC